MLQPLIEAVDIYNVLLFPCDCFCGVGFRRRATTGTAAAIGPASFAASVAGTTEFSPNVVGVRWDVCKCSFDINVCVWNNLFWFGFDWLKDH